MALVRRKAMPDLFLTWPELDAGLFALQVSVCPASDALWVLYEGGHDGGPDSYTDLQGPAIVAAARIGVNGSVGFVRAEGTLVMRATRAGLWTGTSFCEHIDDRYLSGEQPTDWAMPTMLQIHLPGHPTRTLEVDRYVNAVREEDQELVLFVTPSPPVAHHASEMISYEYRCTALELGPVDQLPEHVKFRDFVPRGWGTPVAPERLGLDNDPFGPTHDSTRIDLSAVAGSRWRHMALTDVQKAHAVKANGSV